VALVVAFRRDLLELTNFRGIKLLRARELLGILATRAK